MLSGEEKQAIEYWKTHMKILHWNTQLASEHYIKVLLDLVEKQSKEIEELKEEIKNFTIEDEKIFLQFGEIIEKKRWKDKIKAKIEEYKKQQKEEPDAYLCIKVLSSLLEKE